MSVLTTVNSRLLRHGAEGMEKTDVSRKNIDNFYGRPEVINPSGLVLFSMPQEHGRLRLDDMGDGLRIGEKVKLLVGDANKTINLCDKFYAMWMKKIEAV